MRRSGPIKRKTRVNPVNRARKAQRQAEQFGPQAELCRTLPCAVCGTQPPSDPAHVRSRGAGGRDRGNVIPLCRSCHSYQHAQGWEALTRLARAHGGSAWEAEGIARALEQTAYEETP